MTFWVEGNYRFIPSPYPPDKKYILCTSEAEFLKHIDKEGTKIFEAYFRDSEDKVMAPYYCSPLYFAIRCTYVKGLQKLIELGLEITNLHSDGNHPPLIPFACSLAKNENYPAYPGLSPKDLRLQRHKLINLLLDHGADINATDTENKSALEYLLEDSYAPIFIGFEWSYCTSKIKTVHGISWQKNGRKFSMSTLRSFCINACNLLLKRILKTTLLK